MCSPCRCPALWFCYSLAVAGSGPALADEKSSEHTASNAARCTRTGLATDAQRSLRGYRNELTEVGYRWWATGGRTNLGLGIGTVAYVARPIGPVVGQPVECASYAMAAGTVLTLGMHYRTSASSALYADAAGVHGAGFEGDRVVGKLGIEFKAAQSRWNVGYGGLGLKLSGDMRMQLRISKGGVRVSMRTSF